MSLLIVPDIGPKTVELLLKKEVKSIEDLISFYPNTYSTYNYNTIQGRFYLHGIIKSQVSTIKLKRGLSVSKFDIRVENKTYKVVAFNQLYLYHTLKIEDQVTLYGTYDEDKKTIVMNKIVQGYSDQDIFPVYSKIGGLSNNKINKIILNCIELANIDVVTKKHLFNLHIPANLDELSDALYYLKYQEFEVEYLKIIEQRNSLKTFDNNFMKVLDRHFKDDITSMLEYKLTADQNRIVDELISHALLDQKSDHLVVGDVGSGKTIIALIVAYIYVLCGYQVIYLAPTTMLASQVYQEMNNYLADKVSLVTSESKKREVNKIKKDIKALSSMMVIGTHAILNDELIFSNLGLAIIDEQHRFGVEQRNQVMLKGDNVDMLALTATPIPRTLAKTLYGAVNVKQIDLPHYHGITKTTITNNIEDLNFYVNKYADNKVFIVVPVIDRIEESEFFDLKAVEKLISSQCVNKKICSLSSRTKNKTELINNLDEYDIIIATSVIEVGVDIADARCMFILNAEKYGVAQLHQLRGRIGRNNDFNECILHTTTTNVNSLKRLEMLVKTSDGFALAKYDLVNRGGGTLFGNKQSGNNDFKLFDLSTDLDIVQDVINNNGESL